MPSKTASSAVANDSQPSCVPVGSSGSGRNSVTENISSEGGGLPQQILAIIQHKWRNLEKRKKKLDEYKKIGDANLKADQREALSHFGEVVQLLDLLGDMKKQFETTFVEYETQQKRQLKRDKAAQRQRDMERMRDLVEVRMVLNTLGDESLRNELRRNEKVSDAELLLIDKFYENVEPTTNKTDAFLSTAADHIERLLRKDEKPFFEKQSYAHLRTVLSRLYQDITASNVEAPNIKLVEQKTTVSSEEAYDTHRSHSEETSADFSSRLAPTSPQLVATATPSHQAAPSTVSSEVPPATKLEEIVKPGSFSFLQESQISSGGPHGQNRSAGNHSREQQYLNDYAKSDVAHDQEIGPWVQHSPNRAVEQDTEPNYDERTNSNSAVWSNRGNASSEAGPRESYPPAQTVPYSQEGGQGRNRDRGGRQQQQHHQQQRNRRPFVPSGGADENNEAAASGGWPADDADFSEWKSVDAGSAQNRESGGWIGGQDSRRRGGGSGRGGRGGFHRGGGQNSGGFGDNRRHFNRGPRPGGPSNQQHRSAATVGSGSGQPFAE